MEIIAHSAINVQTWAAPRHPSLCKGCSWKTHKEFPCAISGRVGGPEPCLAQEKSSVPCSAPTGTERNHSAHSTAWPWLTPPAERSLSAASPVLLKGGAALPAKDPSHWYSWVNHLETHRWGNPKQKIRPFLGTTKYIGHFSNPVRGPQMYQGLPWFLSQKDTPGASSWGCLWAGAQICSSAPAFQFHVLGADSLHVPDYKVGLGLLWVSGGWGAWVRRLQNTFHSLSAREAGEASHLASLPLLSKPLAAVS